MPLFSNVTNPFTNRRQPFGFGNFNNDAQDAFGNVSGGGGPAYTIDNVRVNPDGTPVRESASHGFGQGVRNPVGGAMLSDPGVPGGGKHLASGFDQNIQSILRDIFAQKQKDEQYNSNQKDAAIGMLTGPKGLTSQISGFYDPLIKQTESSIPLNPFTDVMKQKMYARIQDDTNKEVESLIREASESLAAKGYGSGGTSGQTQAGGIVSEGIATKNKGMLDVDTAQLDFNTQSNAGRQQMINSLASQKAGMIGNATGVASSIAAGNTIDPKASADILSNAFGIQLSEDNHDKMMEFIKSMEPSMIEKFAQTIPGLLQILNPSMQGVTMGADMFIDALTSGSGGVF